MRWKAGFVAIRSLAPFSGWMTCDVFSLTRKSGFASAVEFFVFDTPKVLLLLTLVVFGVGVARNPAIIAAELKRGDAA